MDDHTNTGMDPAGDTHSNPKTRTPWNTVEGRVISLVSRKGGVGKTTSAVNLGAALALSGHTVLIVGTDPQCGVCRTLGKGPDDVTSGLNQVFGGEGSLTDLALPSALDGLFYISPNIDSLDEEELYMENMTVKADVFAAEIDRARNLYDTILIDCPPSLGAPTLAALLASDSYLVPVQAEELCRGSVEPLLQYVDSFRTRFFPTPSADEPGAARVVPLALEGMFLTMSNLNTRMGRHVAGRVDEDFGQWLFASNIPRNTRLSEMALKGKPAVIFDRRSKGSRAYFDLADELVLRFVTGARPEDPLHGEFVDSEVAHLEEVESPSSSSPEAMDGLNRFLAELGGQSAPAENPPVLEEPVAPEMVSLDDLLAEEENQAHSSGNRWNEYGTEYNSDDPDSDQLLN